MALVTNFMTTSLLHLVEHIFVRREEKLSLKHKWMFGFGCPESGCVFLSIYDLLFGMRLKKNHLSFLLVIRRNKNTGDKQ